MKRKKSENRRVRLASVNTVMMCYLCILSVILIALVDVIFYIIVSGTLENQASERIKGVGGEVAVKTSFAPSYEILEPSYLQYHEDGIFVYLFTSDGQKILPDALEISQSKITELFSFLQNKKIGEDVIYNSSGSVNFGSKVRYNGGEEEGVILVTYSLSIVRQTMGRMQLYLLMVSLVVLVLAFLISYKLSAKLTRGLKNLSDSAVKLAKGDYDVSFTNADYREVAQLSDSLNYMRDEVKKSGDFQREILANVTHDLKTPLTMIKAYASMVREISGDNPEKRNAHLQVIIDEADRLTALVNDVLAVSKVRSNLGEINLKVFNLTEFLYGIINKFGYLKESGYNIMVDIQSNLYTRADEEKINQVIFNLLGNAVNYTGEDKTVYISLKRSIDGERIKLSVRDTGKGISDAELPNIWDRYYRSEENHVRPVKGSGLGLNIVKDILTKHSFDFGVESRQGEGATFWVDFPYVPEEIPASDG